MTVLLLVVIYIAFIGLGVPDSLFGSAWPAIYEDLNLPISSANLVTGLTTCGTITASLFSAKIINKFGTAKITAVSTLFTACALLGYSFSGNLLWFCLFSVPCGFGAGAIDAALNNYVALHYKASHMNFLHCFYGVGVSLSPYIMSVALSGENGWRGGYRLASCFQLGIALVMIISLPLWKKCSKIHTNAQSEEKPKTLSFKEIFKLKGIRIVLIAFFTSCAIEFVCGIWGSTYLVEDLGMKPQNAAKMIVLYYIGMALGRFLSGVFASKLSSNSLIRIGAAIMAVSVVLLVISCKPLLSSATAAAIGLFLMGVGNAPTYPNLVHLTPDNFGADVSQSVMGMQMAAASTGILLAPIIFGFIAQHISLTLYPFFVLLLFIPLLIAIIRVASLRKK